MYNTKVDDLARIANDLTQLARKYSEGAQQVDQQAAGLDGTTQRLIAGGPEHWLGVSSIAFQGAWDERWTRLQQISRLLNEGAQHFTQFAQTIEEYLPTIRADQAVQQSLSNHLLGPDDQKAIWDEESQAQNAIITALSLLNSQLEQMAGEVKDCPQEREAERFLGSDAISGSDTGDTSTGGNDTPATTEESINQKLDKYLLNPDHPAGRSKANWFRLALGFTRENAADLAKQIVFDESSAVETGVTPYGTKFNQTIRIVGANGKVINVLFAWIKNNDGVVRLVTAIPPK